MRLIDPGGPGWKRVRATMTAEDQAVLAAAPAPGSSPTRGIVSIFLACLMVYAALFGTGWLLYGQGAWALGAWVVVVASALGLVRSMRRPVGSA